MQTLPFGLLHKGCLESYLAGLYSRRHDTVSPTAWIYFTLLMSAAEYSKLVEISRNDLPLR